MENALGMDSLLEGQGLTTGVIFVATSLYGSFLVLFILSSLILHFQVLTNKKQSSGSTGTLIYLTLGYLLFFAASSSWVILWIISAHPSLGQIAGNGTEFGTLLYIQNVAEVLAAVVADWILLYRLYIIWQKKSVILMANALVLVLQVVVAIRDAVYYARNRRSWVAGNFILASILLLVNIVATALIAWKLWNTNRRHIQGIGGQKVLNRVIAIIVESAAINTTWTIVYLVLFVAKREASYSLLHCLPSIAGITASLVNVRVGFGWAAGEQGRTSWSLRDSIIDDPVTVGVHD